jgi:hypothetical protein
MRETGQLTINSRVDGGMSLEGTNDEGGSRGFEVLLPCP